MICFSSAGISASGNARDEMGGVVLQRANQLKAGAIADVGEARIPKAAENNSYE